MKKRIDLFKSNLKSVYEAYKSNLSNKYDKSLTICDVASCFNIELDNSRLSDYLIERIDLDNLSIDIKDNKTGTRYSASCLSQSKVFGVHSYDDYPEYLRVIVNNGDSEIIKIYTVGSDIPQIEKLSVEYGDYKIVLNKVVSDSYNGLFNQDGSRYQISYLRKDEDNRDCELYCSVYKNVYKKKKYIDYFKRDYIGKNHLTYDTGVVDNYMFSIDGKMIYGSRVSNKGQYIDGACFEEVNRRNIVEALTRVENEQITRPSTYNINGAFSAVLYSGYSFNNGVNLFHDFQLFKRFNSFDIKYTISDLTPNCKNPMVKFYTINIPCLNDGYISSTEIDNVIIELQSTFADDQFISFVIEQINEFKNKLLGNEKDNGGLFVLSPETMIRNNFDNVSEMVINNKELYFSEMNNRFENIVNKGKGKHFQKTIKKTDE